ncbi:MAG: hypothetical protein AMXMBFR75_28860 [Candidatus Hinthialibacteria bacterium]|nr:Segregation and condensation protein A [bacterium]MCE7906879.1 segregation/condensation protein A [Candidatus Omnitrophica bacterium COP1]
MSDNPASSPLNPSADSTESPRSKTEESVSPTRSSFQVNQDVYQGPLDKLLDMARDYKIDIFQVSLSVIADEFLAHVRSMERHNLDEIGDFLVIAGYLMVLKSRQMLPSATEAEEEAPEIDEEQLLLQRLKDYERFREAADLLRKAEADRRLLYWRDTPPPSVGQRDAVEFYEVNVFDLANAFKRVLAEIGEDRPNLIQGEEYTIDEKMAEIQLLLHDNGEMCLTLYLASMHSRVEIIVTFLALLELIRLLKVSARQSIMLGDIWIYRVDVIKRDAEGEVELTFASEESGFIGEQPLGEENTTPASDENQEHTPSQQPHENLELNANEPGIDS